MNHFNARGAVLLLPDIQFSCNGYIKSIEAWMYFNQTSTAHFLRYEIWRPVMNTASQQNELNLVASTNISDVTPNRDITNNIRSYSFIGSPGQLQFQKNDIFGMFVPDPLSGDPFFPTYLIETEERLDGMKFYWVKTGFSVCSVSLCYNGFNVIENVKLQIKIKQGES